MRIEIVSHSPLLSASSPLFPSHRWKFLKLQVLQSRLLPRRATVPSMRQRSAIVKCLGDSKLSLRTCKNCKKQFDPSLNNPGACRFHTAHFGGETKRKFESVYKGGTMNTPDSGKVLQYWHCCGSEDPFDTGCTAAPHCSYDD